MREIKFRVFDKINKAMCNVLVIEFVDTVESRPGYQVFRLKDKDTYWIDKFNAGELLQFTGLYDKNGKEIYEGDIVKYVCHFVVKFGEYSVKGFAFNGWYLWGGSGITCLNGISRYEIIGNIYENPELLEGQK